MKPIRIASLRVSTPRPADAAPIARAFTTELPPSYVELLERCGAGMFCGRVRFMPPDEVVRATKKWRARWEHRFGKVFFTNYDTVLGKRAFDLITVASSIEGDQVGFVAGAPHELLILPRNRNAIVVAKSLAEVLGWYLEVARGADGPNTTAKYVPEASKAGARRSAAKKPAARGAKTRTTTAEPRAKRSRAKEAS